MKCNGRYSPELWSLDTLYLTDDRGIIVLTANQQLGLFPNGHDIRACEYEFLC